ncbi:MAG: peptidase S9 [Bacteroidetes bacterium GWC2_33_15]|nr:MAG: peptidase S9 [Bacteroidetes bacterium GWA2_33_15]OFX50470.1 MAG: peptidase S9 [Bacteroidetes bacterium GWC2_33_15]OFX66612.1 MAG: peptidase S9 [Bacteroidetes bacterium GWB2_32_14]OFX69230.1 MAG: peptidase S9 [Bacteroidetes bacterium GWD2_33_33]HAN18541.1 peptidase S9 [Bacteroidales bacterium]
MNKTNLFLFATISFFVFSCKTEKQTKLEINNPVENIKLTSDIMTPEVLWSFGRVSEVQVSPDGKTILFGVSFFNIEKNKGNRELFTIPVEGGNAVNITNTESGEYSHVWRPDGKKIGFLSTESESLQLWEMDADGKNRVQISTIEGGINGFKYSPDQTKILFIKDVKLDKSVTDIYPDLPKADARIETDLMYRHWDKWHDYTYSHVFFADYDGKSLSNIVDIMEGERFDSPLKPFGGIEQISWSPDGKTIAYTSKKLVGKAYSLSTNSEIFMYNLETKQTENISEGLMGYDISPVFSNNGKKIAWESMKNDGYESDKNRVFIYDLETKSYRDYTSTFDQNAHGLAWAKDDNTIYFTSDFQAKYQIYKLDVGSGQISPVTKGNHNYLSVEPVGNTLIGTKQSISMPTEIYSINPVSGEETQLSFINKNLLDQLSFGNVEERWIKTTDNKQMLVWVIYPPHFDANKKYPAILYCQGGPQSSVSQFFSYRWNFQMMAANNYIVVAPNRRGVPSFGSEWNEQISRDYGGQNMKDYLSAIDEIAKEPFVDNKNLGAVGASYGGFSVYWLAGNHDNRFDAFIAHDGMFNLEAQYLETEEMFFVNWDLGGPYWDKSTKKTYENSPHRFVDKWNTPIMVVHGEQDFRIAFTQGMSAFNAAQLKGIPSKYLHFHNENHWVLQPQNGILWQREFFGWLDQWLKDEE